MGSHDVSSERSLYRRGCASALTLTFRRVHNRSPSCWHGVTTVVFGNCGVTFAPCWQDDHDFLIELMEGVEVRTHNSPAVFVARRWALPLGLTPPLAGRAGHSRHRPPRRHLLDVGDLPRVHGPLGRSAFGHGFCAANRARSDPLLRHGRALRGSAGGADRRGAGGDGGRRPGGDRGGRCGALFDLR